MQHLARLALIWSTLIAVPAAAIAAECPCGADCPCGSGCPCGDHH